MTPDPDQLARIREAVDNPPDVRLCLAALDTMTEVARRFRHGWFVAMDGESWKHLNGPRLVQITEAERHALDALEVHDA